MNGKLSSLRKMSSACHVLQQDVTLSTPSRSKKRVEEDETSIPVLVVECQFHLFLPLFLSLIKVLSDMLRDMSTLENVQIENSWNMFFYYRSL